jgi:hypothetical protein
MSKSKSEMNREIQDGVNEHEYKKNVRKVSITFIILID